MLRGLTGHRNHFIPQGMEQQDGHGSYTSSGPGHQNGPLTWDNGILFKMQKTLCSSKTSRPKLHAFEERESLWFADHPVPRHPDILPIPTRSIHAQVIASTDDLIARLPPWISRFDYDADRIDSWSMRIFFGHTAVAGGRECILVIEG